MDPKFQTSFIPKKTVDDSKPRLMGVLTAIAGFVFLCSLLGAAGVYFYSGQLDSKIASSQVELKNNKDAFDLPLIETLIRLDKRIEASKMLLNKHLAVTPLFQFFEKMTVKSISLDSFSYIYSPQKVTVSAHGVAESLKAYNSIAYQAELFADDRLIKDPIFSDFGSSQGGSVAFSFGATIDPRLLSYNATVAQ